LWTEFIKVAWLHSWQKLSKPCVLRHCLPASRLCCNSE